jgi:hypothetical protein
MDLLNSLNKLREYSFDTMVDVRPGLTAGGGGPQHGKPGDYGFMGRSRNMPVTPRMAGGNIMSALIGHASGGITAAAKPYMDSAMGALAGQIKGLNSNVAGNY